MQEYIDNNRRLWDGMVPFHVASEFYDVASFKAGRNSLMRVELEEVGPVTGKSLLHLQCHFGMDTLNWARLGASVTGLDFSQAAVERARALAEEISVTDARFVQSNVYDAPQALGEQFDIVYTGIGALNWLPDIRGWARVAAGFVKPGGFLYLYEGHPMLWALDEERQDGVLALRYPYFEVERPIEWDSELTYTDGPPLKNTKGFEWNHGLGEIATALIEAGLRLDFIHEHREIAWKALDWMEPADGAPTAEGSRHQRRTAWRLPEGQRDLVPLMYSLKASAPPP
jgi:SAM-dependent methyltransferase